MPAISPSLPLYTTPTPYRAHPVGATLVVALPILATNHLPHNPTIPRSSFLRRQEPA